VKTILKKTAAVLLFACLAFQVTSCSLVSKGLKQFDEMTGISREMAEEFTKWKEETFPAGKKTVPDKSGG